MVFEPGTGSLGRGDISQLFLGDRQMLKGQRRMRIGGQLVRGICKIASRESTKPQADSK